MPLFAAIPGPVPTAPQMGLLAWNYPSVWAAGSAAAATSGVVYLLQVPLNPVSISVTNILVGVSTGGGTLTSTENFAGLYDNTGTKIAGTADQTVAWGSTGLKTMALTSGPFTGSWPFVYVVLVANGTTGPAFSRGAGSAIGSQLITLSASGSSMPFATNGTGATALPGSLTYSSNSAANNPQSIWCGLS